MITLARMTKILVIQTAFIGDAVLASAILEKLHKYFPDSQIDILVRKGNESLFSEHPFLHKVLTWNKKERKYPHLLSLLNEIRRSRYDKVINLQRFAATGFLTAFSKAKQRIGFKKNPFRAFFTKRVRHLFDANTHEVVRNNKLIEHFTDAEQNNPRLYPSQENYARVGRFVQGHYITVSPLSVWFTKQYPKQKWIDFLDSVPGDINIYLLGGASEADKCNEIKSASANKNITVLAGQLSFLDSAALMEKALMNYTNDSAPLHIASAVNAPVAAIFCSTVPGFGFYPLSDRSHIIQTLESLPCKPCSLHGLRACPLEHFKCGYTIQNSQLLNTLPSHELF